MNPVKNQHGGLLRATLRLRQYNRDISDRYKQEMLDYVNYLLTTNLETRQPNDIQQLVLDTANDRLVEDLAKNTNPKLDTKSKIEEEYKNTGSNLLIDQLEKILINQLEKNRKDLSDSLLGNIRKLGKEESNTVTPLKFYSKNQQKSDAKDFVDRESEKLFKGKKDSIRLKIRQKEAELADLYVKNTNKSFMILNVSGVMSGVTNYDANIDKVLNDIENLKSLLKETERQEQRYKLSFLSYTDPDQSAKNYLFSTIGNSSFYLKNKSQLESARKNALAIEPEQSFIRNHNEKEDSAFASKAVLFREQANRLYKINNDIDDLMNYISNVGVLPNNIDQLPRNLRDIASKVLVDDKGNGVLSNEEWRKAYYENQVILPELFKYYSKYAKDSSKHDDSPSSEQLRRKLDEIRLLKAARLSDPDNKKGSKLDVGFVNYTPNAGTPYIQTHSNLTSDLAKLEAADLLLEKAARHKELNEKIMANVKDYHLYADTANTGHSVKEFFWDDAKNTFGFDLPNITIYSSLNNSLNKLENGKKLNSSDRTLLESKVIEDIYHSNYGDYEDVDAYKWGKITAESLKFMSEFILTRGAFNVMNTAGRTAVVKGSRALEKLALDKIAKYGEKRALKMLKDAAIRLGTGKATKIAKTLAVDATYSGLLENTLGGPKTMLDAELLRAGNVIGEINPYTQQMDIKGAKNRKSVADAFSISEKRNWIENFSEMMGEWGIGKALKRASKWGVGKLASKSSTLKSVVDSFETAFSRDQAAEMTRMAEEYAKLGILDMNAIFAKTGLGKFIPRMDQIFNRNVLKAGQFHGFLGEVSEEYYGIVLQNLMGVSESTDPENQGGPGRILTGDMWKRMGSDFANQTTDILGGIGMSTALLGAFGMGSSIYHLVKYNNAEQKLVKIFGKDEAERIRKTILFAPTSDVNKFAVRLMGEYGVEEKEASKLGKLFGAKSKTDFTDKAKAILNYAQNLVSLRGAVYGEELVNKQMGANRRRILLEAFEQGYRNGDYVSLKQALDVQGILKMESDSAVGQDTDKLLSDNGDSIVTVLDKINNGDIAVEDKEKAMNALLSYYNSQRFVEGANQRFSDLAKQRSELVKQNVLRTINVNNGQLVTLSSPVSTEEGPAKGKQQHVFIIDGKYKAVPGSKELNTDEKAYAKGDDYILVYTINGRLKRVKRSEFKGWDVEETNESKAEMQLALLSYLFKQMLTDWDQMDSYLQTIGANPRTGDSEIVGDKKITILDARPGYGITYAVSDLDGSNSKIYNAEDYYTEEGKASFEKFKLEIGSEKHKEITKFFNDQADSIIKETNKYLKQRYKAKKAKEIAEEIKAQEDWDTWYNGSELDNEVDQSPEAQLRQREEYNKQLAAEQAAKEAAARDAYYNGNLYGDYDEEPDDEETTNSEEPTEPTEEEQLQKDKLAKAISTAGQLLKISADADVLNQSADEIEKAVEAAKDNKFIPQAWFITATSVVRAVRLRVKNLNKRKAASKFTDEQNDAYSKLLQFIEENQKCKVSRASGFHYFIVEDDGKVHLERRVHSVLHDRLENTDNNRRKTVRKQDYILKLTEAFLNGGIEELFKEDGTIDQIINDKVNGTIKRSLDEQEDNAKRSDTREEKPEQRELEIRASLDALLQRDNYKKYLEENGDDESVKEVIEGIASILADNISPSVISGNLYDTIARVILHSENPEDVQYDSDELSIEYFGVLQKISDPVKYTYKDGKTVKEFYLVSKEAFEKIKSELLEVRKYYEELLQWKLCTNPFTLHCRMQIDGKLTYVAGETDCIAVDEEGRLHLIDFKTYHYIPGKKVYFNTPNKVKEGGVIPGYKSDFFKLIASSETGEFYLDEKGDNAILFSQATQYANQLGLYKIMAHAMGKEFQTTEALLFGLNYENIAYTVSIQEENVNRSALRIKDTESGELVPNRVRLDIFAALNVADTDIVKIITDLENKYKAVVTNSFDKAVESLNNLEYIELPTDKEVLKYVSDDVIRAVNKFNKDLKKLKEKALPKRSDAKDRFITSVNDQFLLRLNLINAMNKSINENRLAEQEQLKREEALKKSLEDSFSVETPEDALTTFDIIFSELIMSINQLADFSEGVNIDDIKSTDMAELIEKTLALDTYIRYYQQRYPDEFLKNENHINDAKTILNQCVLLFENKGLANIYYDRLLKGWILQSDVIDEELQEELRKGPLQYTTLSDKAGSDNVSSSVAINGEINPNTKDVWRLGDVFKVKDLLTTSDVHFYIQRKEGKDKRTPIFQMVVVYNGMEFSPVTINFARLVNDISSPLTKEASSLYHNLCIALTKEGDRTEIEKSSINRTFGQIKNVGLHKIDVKKLFGIDDIFDINILDGNNKFGVTRPVAINGKKRISITVPNLENVSEHTSIYIYSGRNTQTNPIPGVVVGMYDPGFEEKTSNKAPQRVVPINLESVEFNEKTAQLVLDILTGVHSTEEDGQIYDILHSPFLQDGIEYPFTNGLVLELFIRFGNQGTKRGNQLLRLVPDMDGNIHITGLILVEKPDKTKETNYINKAFDLTSEEDKKSFAEFLVNARIKILTSESFLTSKLNQFVDSLTYNDFMYDHRESNFVFKLGNTGIYITKEDIKGKNGKVLTGLGFYIRSGLLQTKFSYLTTPLINIDESARIESAKEAPAVEGSEGGELDEFEAMMELARKAAEAKRAAENDGENPSGSVESGGFMNKQRTISDSNLGTIQEEEANSVFDLILGEWFVKWVDEDIKETEKNNILKTLENSIIVGQCHALFTIMSRRAARGDEYHEAFHTVLELIVSEKVRKKAYDNYRSAYKKRYNIELTDKEIAEHIADQFQYYAQNRPESVKWSINPFKWKRMFGLIFGLIYCWYKFYTTIGSIGLMRLYQSALNGNFRNVKVTKEAIDRFNAFSEKGYFNKEYTRTVVKGDKTKTLSFKRILNLEDYNGVKACIQSIVVDDRTYTGSGRKFDWTGLRFDSLTPDMIITSPALMEILTDPGISLDSRLKLMEVMGIRYDKQKGELEFENDNLELLIEDICKPLQQHNINMKTGEQLDKESKKQKEDRKNLAKKVLAVDELSNLGPIKGGEYEKESAEFDPLTRASEVVKLFFSCVPQYEVMDIFDLSDPKNPSKWVYSRKLNKSGLPQLEDYKTTYNRTLAALHRARSIRDLLETLQLLSENSPQFKILYTRYLQLCKDAFVTDENGEFVYTDDHKFKVKNYDIFPRVVEIADTINMAAITPYVCKSMQNDETTPGLIKLVSTNFEYLSLNFRYEWGKNIISGDTKFITVDASGKLVLRRNAAAQIDALGKWFTGFCNLFTDDYNDSENALNIRVSIDRTVIKGKKVVTESGKVKKIKQEIGKGTGIDIDINNSTHLRALKKAYVDKLKSVGIDIDMEDFDFMLMDNFGSTDAAAMKKYISQVSAEFNGIFKAEILTWLKDPEAYRSQLSLAYSNNKTYYKFVDLLSKGKYGRLARDYQTKMLTINGKAVYLYSENNFITDRLTALQDKDSEQLKNFLQDPFYYLEGGLTGQGSAVLRAISNMGSGNLYVKMRERLEFRSAPGFNIDLPGSKGTEYLDLSEPEDILLKYTILSENGLILPPIADKTTYGGIFGLSAFGIDFARTKKIDHGKSWEDYRKFIIDNYKILYDQNGQLHITLPRLILEQFVSYAECEFESAERELIRVNNLPEEERVAYYHNNETTVIEDEKKVTYPIIQGARLSTFTGIHKDGKFISFNTVLDENGHYKNEQLNLNTAYEEFFRLKPSEKAAIIENELNYMIRKEIKNLVRVGLIEQHEGEDGLLHYINKGLDKYKIRKILRVRNTTTNEEFVKSQIDENDPDMVEDTERALLTYIADMSLKAAFSHEEALRIYSGNLADYKMEFSEITGHLSNSTKDYFKRLGGLASTGTHHITDVEGIKDKIVCAEVNDEFYTSPFMEEFGKMSSEQEIKKSLKALIRELKSITINNSTANKKAIEKMIEEVDNMTEQEAVDKFIEIYVKAGLKSLNSNSDEDRKTLKSQAESIIKVIKDINEQKTEAFKGIDVNDGATYITDEMCEMLLKSLGRYNSNIQKAFELLRTAEPNSKGEYTNQQLRDMAEAYNKVRQSLIGMYKYTAFGQRPVLVTIKRTIRGDKDGKTETITYTVNETYYDKTAYAPIFMCMASGHMKAVLKKMKEQGVDVLKVTSAIKEGNKGSQDMDERQFEQFDKNPESFANFKFNTYEQPFNEMRRQFNTEPKQEHLMNLGTQYQKVVLSLLSADEIYTTEEDGTEKKLSALEVRDYVMKCFNKIQLAGMAKHMSRFYNQDNTLNVDAFSSILQKQIADRDADDPIIESLTTVTVEGKKLFKIPIAAMSSTNWIESIVVSLINSDIVDITTPGAAFYQRSVWGMEGIMPTNYVSDEDFGYSINHGSRLKEMNEEGSMDCVLTIDYFDYVFEQHPGLEFQSFAEKENYLIQRGYISGWNRQVLHNDDKTTTYKNIYETFEAKENDVFMKEDGTIVEVEAGSDLIGTTVTGMRWKHAKANIVGYRIPTQAVSSIHAMRCVGVIPVLNHTIILPKAVTAITGSDFDIDKFFLSTMFSHSYVLDDDIRSQIDQLNKEVKDLLKVNSKIQKELEAALRDGDIQKSKELAQLHEDNEKLIHDKKANSDFLWDKNNVDTTEGFDKDSREYWCNKLIQLQLMLLKTTDNNISLLKGSIDKDTTPLKKMAKEILDAQDVEEYGAFDSVSLKTAVDAKMAFAVGKKGIGPFALNNNNHVLTILYGVRFIREVDLETGEPTGILSLLDLDRLDRVNDRNHRSILSTISGLINAHVDVAKDPYIRSLGVNEYTYNLVALLIRTGYGHETFWYTTQPIMKKIYDAYFNAAGVYMQSENSGSKYTRTKNAIDAVVVQHLNSVTGKTDEKIWDAKKSFNTYLKNKNLKYNDVVVALMKDKRGVEVMHLIATTPESKVQHDKLYQLNDEISLTYDEIQAMVAMIHYQLMEKAQNISDLVQYTKIDTKKQGKNIIEQHKYQEGFKKLTDFRSSPFEKDGITRMLNAPLSPEHAGEQGVIDIFGNLYREDGSFIGPKTYGAIIAVKNLLASQLYQATEGYARLYEDICRKLNITEYRLDQAEAIHKMILAKIKADYFFKGPNSYCAKRQLNPDEIMGGKRSIFYRLSKIKAELTDLSNPKYDFLRDKDGNCTNYLLKTLITTNILNDDNLYDGRTPVDSDKNKIFAQDDWFGTGFVEAGNKGEDNVKQSYMSNAWLELLNDTQHEEIRSFAEQLIVYAFMTSGDMPGRYNLFKFVPPKWVTGECEMLQQSSAGFSYKDSYAYYHSRMLLAYNDPGNHGAEINMSDDEIWDMIYNFAFDEQICPIVSQERYNDFTTVYTNNATGEYLPWVMAGINYIPISDQDSSSVKLVHAKRGDPAFIKVSVDGFKPGLNKYRTYRMLGYGDRTIINKDGRAEVVSYPVYVLVKPRGGKYKFGQKVISIDVNGSSSKLFEDDDHKVTYADYLEQYFTSLLASEYGKDIFNGFVDCSDLLNQLIYLQNSKKKSENSLLPVLIPMMDNEGGEIQNLLLIISDMLTNITARDQTPKSIEERRALAGDSYDMDQFSTNLLLDQRELPTIYRAMSREDAVSGLNAAFDDALVQRVINSGAHVEFYKREYETDDGKKKWSPTMTISLNRGNKKGFFEIVAEINENDDKPTGMYAIHFRTFSAKANNNTPYAQIEMTRENKNFLKRMALMALPVGSRLSTRGIISKGGLNAIETLDRFAGGLFYLINDGVYDRTVEYDGEKVKIPVWRKITSGMVFDSNGNDVTEKIKQARQKAAMETQTLKDVKKLFYDEVTKVINSGKVATSTNPINDATKIAIENNEVLKNAVMRSSNSELSNIGSFNPGLADVLIDLKILLTNDSAADDTNSACSVLFPF